MEQQPVTTQPSPPPQNVVQAPTVPVAQAPAQLRPPVPPRPRVQRRLILLLCLMVVWITIGRAFFGVGGWLLFVGFLFYMPWAGVYITVTGLMLRHKNQQGYVMSKPVQRAFIGLLFCMFVAGLTMVEFGDAPNSTQSLLAAIMGQPPGDGSGAIVQVSSIIANVASIAHLVLAAVALTFMVKDVPTQTQQLQSLERPATPYGPAPPTV